VLNCEKEQRRTGSIYDNVRFLVCYSSLKKGRDRRRESLFYPLPDSHVLPVLLLLRPRPPPFPLPLAPGSFRIKAVQGASLPPSLPAAKEDKTRGIEISEEVGAALSVFLLPSSQPPCYRQYKESPISTSAPSLTWRAQSSEKHTENLVKSSRLRKVSKGGWLR